LTPKQSFDDGTLNKVEHVITDSEVTELIVPVHQPIRWACIMSGPLILKLDVVKILRSIVLEITG